MGSAKEKANEYSARGFDNVGKFVCIKCVGDKHLRSAIKSNASSNNCNYCNRKTNNKNIAAPVEVLIALILEGFEYEWANPLNELMYISGEGGWQGEVLDNWDLSQYIQDEAEIENHELIKDIRMALHEREWCKFRDIPQDEVLSFSWNRFTNLIKHKYRYTFYQISEADYYDPGKDDFISPKKILNELSRIIKAHKGLIIELPKGTAIFRGRCFEKKPSNGMLIAKQLGTPPQKHAIYTTRMSPLGIPLFYGALDTATAANEAIDNEKSSHLVVAEFKTLVNLKILDFCSLPKMPSLFNQKSRDTRQVVRFLRKFVDEISRPIVRDGREHIEYVPTQMLSEYFRHIFKYKKEKINGIFYPSSKMKGICCTLFIENEGCIDKNEDVTRETILRLESVVNLECFSDYLGINIKSSD